MMAKLGDVFECQITGEWGSECAENEIGTKVLRTTNFTPEGRINYDDVVVRNINESKVEKKRLHYGDIILEKSGGTEKTPVGRVVFCDEGIEDCIYLCNNFTQAMRVNRAIAIPRYVFYFMWNLHYSGKTDLLQNKTTGIRNLQVKPYLNENCPLPPLDEQRKIAAVLDKVSDLIAKRHQQLDKLDEIVKSRFIEMFGDPEINPKGYEICKLGTLAIKISDGVHAKPVYTETGRPFLSVVNINKGVINFDGCKFVSEEDFQKMIKSTRPERGDILYTKVGATYGIPAYVDTNTEFCLYVSVCLIKPRHDRIDSKFLALSMGMPYIKRQADRRIKGIGVPDLHLNQINEFDIVCPPREKQETFVIFVSQIGKSKLTIQKSLEKLEILKKSLMQQYFG